MISPYIQYSLVACKEALTAANWFPTTSAERDDTGVCVGSGIGSLDDIAAAAQTINNQGVRRVNPYLIPRILANMPSGEQDLFRPHKY